VSDRCGAAKHLSQVADHPGGDGESPSGEVLIAKGGFPRGRKAGAVHRPAACWTHVDPPVCPPSIRWIADIGLDPHLFGTHSLRRTKATSIYRRTATLRAVQLLPGHTKIESTVQYLGKVDGALAIAEQVDV
jgi:hypothetical protein